MFYTLVGLAAVAITYAHITAPDYAVDIPGMEPYVVDTHPVGALLAGITLLYVAGMRGSPPYMPPAVMLAIISISYVLCCTFGVLWWMAEQYPAAIATLCVTAPTTVMLWRVLPLLRGQRLTA